jgi:hypothetical protein
MDHTLPPGPPGRRTPPRSRVACVLAFAATLLLGLASRRWPVAATLLGKYPGDALWALMLFFGAAALWPGAGTGRLVAGTGLACAGVEFAKLWQAPWLVALRHTTAGHLVLGHAFSWQNLAAYAVGVLAGGALDRALPPTKARTTAPAAA